MSNSSDEYWSIDGVSLHQYGWSVTTVGGSRYDVPPRRGENIRYAYRPGAGHRPKLPDSRTVNLVMWVTGTDPATGNAVTDSRLRWNDSWDFLRRLVWKPKGAQVTLTRRWWLTVGGSPTLVSADALAEVGDTMTPEMTGRHRASFTMPLLLADPFFYGPQVTTAAIGVGATVTVTNPGHDVAAYGGLQVDLIGPLTNPKLTNTGPNPDVWVKYGAALPTGQTVRLDIPTFQATRLNNVTYSGGLPYPANIDEYTAGSGIAKVSQFGAREWMALDPTPAANPLTLTADAGTGTAVLRYNPPYV